jgi:phage FluMu protein Com
MTEIDNKQKYFNNYKVKVFDSAYDMKLFMEANPDWNTDEDEKFNELRDNLSVNDIYDIFLCRDVLDKIPIGICCSTLRRYYDILSNMIQFPTCYINNVLLGYLPDFYEYNILFAILKHFRDMNKGVCSNNLNTVLLKIFKKKVIELMEHYIQIRDNDDVYKQKQLQLQMIQQLKMKHNEKIPCENCNKLISRSNMSLHKKTMDCIVEIIKPKKTKKEYMNEKISCKNCNKLVSRSNMSKHKETKYCIEHTK